MFILSSTVITELIHTFTSDALGALIFVSLSVFRETGEDGSYGPKFCGSLRSTGIAPLQRYYESI